MQHEWHWCGSGKIVDRYNKICQNRLKQLEQKPDDDVSRYVLSVLAIKNFPNLLWDQVPIHFERNFTKAEQRLIRDLKLLRQTNQI